MKILNFGSLNLDYVYQVDHFVRPGETTSSLSLAINCGGKGLNQSVALARAGAQVWHAGSVGAADGAILLDMLTASGADARYVRKLDEVATGQAIIQVNRSGQNCILLFGGANQTIDKAQVDETLAEFSRGDFLILQNEITEIGYIIQRAHERGMIIVLNPSPMDEKIMTLPLELVDYFMLNEVEAADLCGNEGDLLDGMEQKFPRAKLVLTLGKDGVCYRDGGETLSHGIYKVPVVDTTAAGDTFTGFFIGCIARGDSPEQALRLASIASSIAVSREGAAPSIPTIAEVEASKLELADTK